MMNEEYILPGLRSCPGCGRVIAKRHVLKIIGKNACEVIAASCDTIIAGAFPQANLEIPVFHSKFAYAYSIATGIKAGFRIQGIEAIVIPSAGDGGTADIGMAALSGAAERNEDLLGICYDNEAYMNTGIQRSSLTPFGAWTTTTPLGQTKGEGKKDLIGILAAHRIPYCATASTAFPEDLEEKVKKAKSIKGLKVIHVFCTCPPGWRSAPEKSVEIARRAVLSKVFPLYEVEGGEKYTINRPRESDKIITVREYFELQGRFKHLLEDEEIMRSIQERVDRELERLQKLANVKN